MADSAVLRRRRRKGKNNKGGDKTQAGGRSDTAEDTRSIYQVHVEGPEVDLSMSQLTSVSAEELAKLRITSIDLSHNSLASLPDNFGILSNIVSLDLSKNQLTSLPKSFGNLGRLSKLDLVSNQLTRLPLSFANLDNLKWLDLGENPWDPTFIPLDIAINPKSDTSDNECRACAVRVRKYMQNMRSQVDKLAKEMGRKQQDKPTEDAARQLEPQPQQEKKRTQRKQTQGVNSKGRSQQEAGGASRLHATSNKQDGNGRDSGISSSLLSTKDAHGHGSDSHVEDATLLDFAHDKTRVQQTSSTTEMSRLFTGGVMVIVVVLLVGALAGLHLSGILDLTFVGTALVELTSLLAGSTTSF